MKILVLSFSVLGQLCMFCQADEHEHLFLARGFDEVGGVDSFFAGRTLVAIEQLKYHRDLKIALYAAWIHCRHKCVLEEYSEIAINRAEFLGFTSGKLNLRLPEWWRNHILKVDQRGFIDFPSRKELNIRSGMSKTKGLLHASNIEVDLSQEDVSVRFGGQAIVVHGRNEGWTFEDQFTEGSPECFAISVLDDGRIVFAITELGREKCRVFCADPDGRKLWSNNAVSSQQVVIGNLRFASSRIEVQADSEKVAVFWVNSSAICLDIFGMATGEPLARFTTLFSIKEQK